MPTPSLRHQLLAWGVPWPDRTVVHVHGGGFVAGIDAFHVRYAARLAAAPAVPEARRAWRRTTEFLR